MNARKNIRLVFKPVQTRASAEKFPGGANKKKIEKSKNRPKNSTLSLFQGGQRKKRPQKSKKSPKNSTIQSLSTIFVPCMKIQRGHPFLPSTDAHEYKFGFVPNKP